MLNEEWVFPNLEKHKGNWCDLKLNDGRIRKSYYFEGPWFKGKNVTAIHINKVEQIRKGKNPWW